VASEGAAGNQLKKRRLRFLALIKAESGGVLPHVEHFQRRAAPKGAAGN